MASEDALFAELAKFEAEIKALEQAQGDGEAAPAAASAPEEGERPAKRARVGTTGTVAAPAKASAAPISSVVASAPPVFRIAAAPSFEDPAVRQAQMAYSSAAAGTPGMVGSSAYTGPARAAPAPAAAATTNKQRRFVREAGGEVWEDPTLADWPESACRARHALYVRAADVAPQTILDCSLATCPTTPRMRCWSDAFRSALPARCRSCLRTCIPTRLPGSYASFQKAKIVKDKITGKNKGFGFVSLTDPHEAARAMREMNGVRSAPAGRCWPAHC